MPRKIKRRWIRRKLYSPFPFLDLPTELQVHILSFVDLRTLYNAILGCRYITQTFRNYPEALIQGATSQLGKQLQNLMVTTYKITRSINSQDSMELSNMDVFLSEHLDTEERPFFLKSTENPIEVLDILCALDWEISSLVQQYAQNIYNSVYHHDNPGVIPPLVNLSPSETHRISRAFWYLKLYGVIFYNYVDHFDVILSPLRPSFLNRLSTFEIDEMVTVYQYMVRCRLHFESAFPHTDCPYIGTHPYRNRDPFECRHCNGRYRPPTIKNLSHWRNQEFWHIIESNYHRLDSLWAEPTVSRDTPVKMWKDMPETNMPNKGWQEWCMYRDLNNDNVNYVVDFRNLGYCFWDDKRMEDLHLVEEWADVARQV